MIFVFAALFILALVWSLRSLRAARAMGLAAPRGGYPFRDTGRHYKKHYCRRGFLRLGGAVAVAAALVYSGTDTAVDSWHASRIRSTGTDKTAHFFKIFGERFWFGFWGSFMLLDSLIASTPLSRWGRRTFEAMVVGLPALWTTQRVLGASRPTDGEERPDHVPDPRYRPFADDNSASGHAFIAAIPWLTLRRHSTVRPGRLAALAAALPTGWSRLNDRKHFFSQIVLGYTLAWQAVDTVGDVGDVGDIGAGPEPDIEKPRRDIDPDGAEISTGDFRSELS